MEAVALVLVVHRLSHFFRFPGACGVSAEGFAGDHGLLEERAHLKGKLGFEPIDLRKQLPDELLSLAVESSSNDVGKIVNPMLRELRVAKRRDGLFELLQEIEEGMGNRVESK